MTPSRLSRRDFLRLTATLSAGAFVAACAPQAPAPSGAEPGVESVELTFDMYNFDPWLRALDNMFADYMEENPNVTVSVEAAPWEEFWSRQEARLAAGTPPDLSIGDPGYFGRYAHRGFYLDMEPCLNDNGIDMGRWFESTLDDARYTADTGVIGSGTLYGLPATFVGTVLYYNKDLFDAAGLPYPDDTWTRNDLFQAAMALTVDANGNSADSPDFDSENIAQWGVDMLGDNSIAVTLWNEGAELISEDQTECRMNEPEAVAVFEWLASLLHENHVQPTPAQMEGLPNPFQVGRVAMTMDGSWNLGYFSENTEFAWDIAPVPLGNSGLPRVTYGGTNTVHIFRDATNVEAACDLILFMTGPGGMEYFANTGIPALQETATSEEFLSAPPDNRQVAVELGNYARGYYPGLKSDLWKQVYNDQIEALWLERGTAQEILDGICEEITPILQTPIEDL